MTSVQVQQALKLTADRLRQHPITHARLEAQLIISAVLNQTQAWLYAHSDCEIENAVWRQIESMLDQRLQGMPLAYVIGEQGFWDLDLKVTQDTLIPRPETELLVEKAFALLPVTEQFLIDLGTGTGAVALALAKSRPHWHIFAVDIENKALSVARYNQTKYQLDNVRLIQADWLACFQKAGFDAIIANPPYIAWDDPDIAPQVKYYEPASALFAADHGLAAINTIIKQASDILKPGGLLLLEHGFKQKEQINNTIRLHEFNSIENLLDLQSHPRMVCATKGKKAAKH